jgi:hypothetical protein
VKLEMPKWDQLDGMSLTARGASLDTRVREVMAMAVMNG